MKLKSKFFLLAVIMAIGTSHAKFADTNPSNLILRVWGADKPLLKARVLAAAQAVGPNGKLILDYSLAGGGVEDLSVDPKEIVESLPKDLRGKVLTVSSTDNYSFPRDTSRGWGMTADGKFRLYGNRNGNDTTDPEGKRFQSYSTLGIAALLNACEGGDFALPSLSSFSSQGGEIVGNGNGLCVVNSNILKADKVTKDFEEHLTSLGCKDVVPAASVHRWRELGLMNGHVDFSVSFIGPRTVMIPALDKECSSEDKTKYLEEWKRLKDNLLEKKLEVVEVPVGGGCVEKNPQFKSGPGSRYVRSYSNAVILNDAILLPEFTGDNPEAAKKLAAYNKRVQDTLSRLMTERKIPQRKILGFPMNDEPVRGGGEVRCMSLEVPGQIKTCTQDRLNKMIEQQVAIANDRADCLKSSFDSSLCHASRDMYETLRFLHDEPARNRVMKTPDGAVIQILNSSRAALGMAIEKLKLSLGKCQ